MTQQQAEHAFSPIILNAERGEEVKVAPYIIYPYDHVDSPDTGEIVLLQGIVDIFTQARGKLRVPIAINAGYRTSEHQAELRRRGYKAAKISPHEHGAAFDLSIARIGGSALCKRCLTLINALKDAARTLGLSDYLRYGYRNYDCTFVHVDIVPMLFDPNWQNVIVKKLGDNLSKFFPYGRGNPNPRDWRGGVTW